jgi:hypothetical protein
VQQSRAAVPPAPPVQQPRADVSAVSPTQGSRVRDSAVRRLPSRPPARAFSNLLRPYPIAGMILSGLVLGMLATALPWRASSGQVVPPSSAARSVPETPAPPEAVKSVAADSAPAVEKGAPARAKSGEPVPGKSGEPEPAIEKREPAPARNAAPRAAAPIVESARLCRALSANRSSGSAVDWPCDPVAGPIGSGALFFYTRLKATRDTTVQHQWYRDNNLYQSVDLRVRANPINGYRTYSRYTIKSGSPGNWRVELRSPGGILLHKEQFVVR